MLYLAPKKSEILGLLACSQEEDAMMLLPVWCWGCTPLWVRIMSCMWRTVLAATKVVCAPWLGKCAVVNVKVVGSSSAALCWQVLQWEVWLSFFNFLPLYSPKKTSILLFFKYVKFSVYLSTQSSDFHLPILFMLIMSTLVLVRSVVTVLQNVCVLNFFLTLYPRLMVMNLTHFRILSLPKFWTRFLDLLL